MTVIDILGSPGSPYTRKMLALLRYRRIPYRMRWGSHFSPPAGYPEPKVKLLPTFYFSTEDGLEAVVDSTPIIAKLEAQYPDRLVRPDDPVLRFVAQLIEDFADEWVTKAMFHFRWHHQKDAAHAGPLLTFWKDPQLDAARAQKVSADFAQRQISRLYVVGSSTVTASVIESSYERLIGIMDRIIARHAFVLGSRPASADFALFGQFTQLGLVDPTPAQLLESQSPRLRAWLDRAEDLSGHDGTHWIQQDTVAEHAVELLREIGRVYVPFLIANASAARRGHPEFETTIDGQQWTQPVFPYQVKCFETLRNAGQSMPAEDRSSLDALLAGTGCEVLFA